MENEKLKKYKMVKWDIYDKFCQGGDVGLPQLFTKNSK
jgi:hypothetical protein